MSTQFKPDYAVPPGDVLADEMEAAQITQSELADRTGLARKTINEIVNGKSPITSETALKFEKVFPRPARFWLNLERNYQETKARLQRRESLSRDTAWLKNLPVKEVTERGWADRSSDKVEQLESMLAFYAISQPKQWNKVWSKTVEVAFRRARTVKQSPYAVSAWLRQGQIEAAKIACKTYNRENFSSCLLEVRSLTRESNPKVFIPKLTELCADSGVAVVFLPELKKTGICGATFWLGETPVIQLSVRYKSDDHLWFTFFHEAGHISLHGKKELFLEGQRPESVKEEEANQFAARTLIPKSKFDELMQFSEYSQDLIVAFASDLGIAPGIVVGQLQHEGVIPYNTSLNFVKKRFAWAPH